MAAMAALKVEHLKVLMVEPLPVLTIGMVSPYRSSFLVSESLDAWLF